MTILDTGPLLAILDRREPAHSLCVAASRQARGPLVTTPIIIAEASHLLLHRGGNPAVAKLVELVQSRAIELGEFGVDRLTRCAEIMSRYADLPMDLGDASLVAEAEARGCRRIFTLDSAFLVYRHKGRASFDLLPEPDSHRPSSRR